MKNILKNLTKNQKIIASVVAVVLVAAISITAVVLNNKSDKVQENKIELKKNNFTLEYGQKFSEKKEDYIIASKEVMKNTNIVIDGKDIESIRISTGKDDFLKSYSVGKHKGTVTYKDKKLNVEEKHEFVVEIKDTSAPGFDDFEDRIEVVKDFDGDLTKRFKAKDISKVTINVDVKNVDFTKPGEYKATVTATDAYKNKTTKDFTVVVSDKTEAQVQEEKAAEEAKKQEEAQEQQVTNNSSAGTTNQGNAGSNTSTGGGSSTTGGNTNTESGSTNTGGGTPPPQVCDQPIGNSGRWFITMNEANNYGYSILSDFNQPYDDFSVWGNEICGYTVHFR